MRVIEALCVSSVGIERKQLAFDEVTGLILEAGQLGVPSSKLDIQYGDDHWLFAGMGDIHIHAREDQSQKHIYKEDFFSASEAALHGGVVQMGDMPNNPIPPIDDQSYENKFLLMKKSLNFTWPYAGIGPQTKPLSKRVPYKAYMGPSIGELYFQNFSELDQAISRYQGRDVSFHCEDPELLELTKNEADHFKRRPAKAEVLATEGALKLIEQYQLKGKLCHFSTGGGLKKIQEARKKSISVEVEVTPQHLYFSEESIPENKKTYFQMNPPIRGKKDQEALWDSFLKGEIDYLATDHAPHTLEEKNHGHSGLTGLDTFGGFVTWLAIKRQVPLTLLAKLVSENPGRFANRFLETWSSFRKDLNLGKGFGFLEKGYRADFTIIKQNAPWKIEKKHLKTKVGHSPFEGEIFPGQVSEVFIAGKRYEIGLYS